MEFKSFFSHSYKSTDVNQYFFEIFSRNSEVQFEVDAGEAPTCVTRLERMINMSDAYIGIYPFSDDILAVPTKDELLNASKYFRLECNIAIRAGIPCMVLCDQRFSDLFSLPRSVKQEFFDYQEIAGYGGSPSQRRFERLFNAFQSEVKAAIDLSSFSEFRYYKSKVGIVVPHLKSSSQGYTENDIDTIQQTILNKGFYSVEILRWPPIYDGKLLSFLENLDFAVVDIGVESMSSGIIGFLHSRCIPCIRLLKGYVDRKILTKRENFKGMFGFVPVGYAKDIIFWKDRKTLAYELDLRLDFIKSPVERINTHQEAIKYFQKAKQRNDTVFLSYSGKDLEIASKISHELKKRFRTVFNYRDDESITPGQPWITEIFDRLSGSKLGIPLISSNYLSSGNCTHEARDMIALYDSDKMAVIPLKIYDEDIELPTWMRSGQYIRYYRYSSDIKKLVDIIEKSYDKGKK